MIRIHLVPLGRVDDWRGSRGQWGVAVVRSRPVPQSTPELRFQSPLIGRVEDWRAGLGRSLFSLLPRPFGCEVSQHLDRATFPVPATSIAACDRDRARTRLTVGEGFPIPLFRLRDGVTVSPWCTFPEAPLKCRTARFPGSGFKPWPIFRGPSQGLARFKRWFVCTLPLLVCPRPRLLSRNLRMCRCYQAGRHTAEKGRQVSRAPLPNLGITCVGETFNVS